ncbi:MAG: hypothetical protein PHS41_07370, partial [Victivallaceae bacterium]|nr:hypothetical protein [Victivallaceae bacterium]
MSQLLLVDQGYKSSRYYVGQQDLYFTSKGSVLVKDSAAASAVTMMVSDEMLRMGVHSNMKLTTSAAIVGTIRFTFDATGDSALFKTGDSRKSISLVQSASIAESPSSGAAVWSEKDLVVGETGDNSLMRTSISVSSKNRIGEGFGYGFYGGKNMTFYAPVSGSWNITSTSTRSAAYARMVSSVRSLNFNSSVSSGRFTIKASGDERAVAGGLSSALSSLTIGTLSGRWNITANSNRQDAIAAGFAGTAVQLGNSDRNFSLSVAANAKITAADAMGFWTTVGSLVVADDIAGKLTITAKSNQGAAKSSVFVNRSDVSGAWETDVADLDDKAKLTSKATGSDSASASIIFSGYIDTNSNRLKGVALNLGRLAGVWRVNASSDVSGVAEGVFGGSDATVERISDTSDVRIKASGKGQMTAKVLDVYEGTLAVKDTFAGKWVVEASSSRKNSLAVAISAGTSKDYYISAVSNDLSGRIDAIGFAREFRLTVKAVGGSNAEFTSGSYAMYANRGPSGPLKAEIRVAGPIAGRWVIESVSKKHDADSCAFFGDWNPDTTATGTDVYLGSCDREFRLDLSAKGYQNAYAAGVRADKFEVGSLLTGRWDITATATIDTADACGFDVNTFKIPTMDQYFKLNVTGKGTGNANAFGIRGDSGTTGGIAGNWDIRATSGKGTAKAYGLGQLGTAGALGAMDEFIVDRDMNLNVTGTAYSHASAYAMEFVQSIQAVTLGGTLTVSATSSRGDAFAYGIRADGVSVTIGTIYTGTLLSVTASGKTSSTATGISANALIWSSNLSPIVIGVQGKGNNAMVYAVKAESVTGDLNGVIVAGCSASSGRAYALAGNLNCTVSGVLFAGKSSNALSTGKRLQLVWSSGGSGKSYASSVAKLELAVAIAGKSGKSDTVSLAGGSIVIGDIDLGGNDNLAGGVFDTLTINGGAQIYGDIT